ncbi:hypothetical protein AAC387_Pa12g0898 [Persea americana]
MKQRAIKDLVLEGDNLVLMENLRKAKSQISEFMAMWKRLVKVLASMESLLKSSLTRQSEQGYTTHRHEPSGLRTDYSSYLTPPLSLDAEFRSVMPLLGLEKESLIE